MLSNLLVYGIAWVMLLGHTGPLRPRDSVRGCCAPAPPLACGASTAQPVLTALHGAQGIFTRLSLILTVLGISFSTWFHVGLLHVFRAAGTRGVSSPAEAAAPAAALLPDSWDSLEGGGGYFPMAAPAADIAAGADSWDSFEGFLLAAHNLPPPPPPPPPDAQ